MKMFEVFKFWLNLGVDGFYLKNLHQMQVKSVYTISHILDDLLDILTLNQLYNDYDYGDSASSDEDNYNEKNEKKFYAKRQVINSSPSVSSSSSTSSIRSVDETPPSLKLKLESNSNLQNLQVNIVKSISTSDDKINKRLGKRILIANRGSIESLTHRKRIEIESELFKPSHFANFSDSGSERNVHFTPSSSYLSQGTTATVTSTAATETTSIQSIDFFSYFHLIDTFLDIRMNETENIRDQVSG